MSSKNDFKTLLGWGGVGVGGGQPCYKTCVPQVKMKFVQSFQLPHQHYCNTYDLLLLYLIPVFTTFLRSGDKCSCCWLLVMTVGDGGWVKGRCWSWRLDYNRANVLSDVIWGCLASSYKTSVLFVSYKTSVCLWCCVVLWRCALLGLTSLSWIQKYHSCAIFNKSGQILWLACNSIQSNFHCWEVQGRQENTRLFCLVLKFYFVKQRLWYVW